MTKELNAQLLSFDGSRRHERITLKSAVEMARDRVTAAILVDAIPDGEVELWWNDPGFPELITGHGYHKGLYTSALKQTVGQVQRSASDKLLQNIGDYFAYANSVNGKMKETRYVKFFHEHLGAVPLRFGEVAEMLLATKREYPPFESAPFSFAPHCDRIDYGRDPRWPIKLDKEQVGAFILIQKSENQAGFVMWDLLVKSRDELDRFASEYAETQQIAAAKDRQSLRITPGSGQLCIFNSRYLHAVEKCASTRQTIGTFLIEQDGGWAQFN